MSNGAENAQFFNETLVAKVALIALDPPRERYLGLATIKQGWLRPSGPFFSPSSELVPC
jgi:hypothetical protein